MKNFLLRLIRGNKPCSCGKAHWEVVNGDGELFVYGLTKSTAEHVATCLSCKDGGWSESERYYAKKMVVHSIDWRGWRERKD